MTQPKMIEGLMTDCNGNYAVVITRWNNFVVDSLLNGTLDTLTRHGVSDKTITIVKVPGAFEVPLTVKRLAEQKKYDAIIALGAVIRGGTPHFDYVAGECVKGLTQVSLAESIPITFGVLTVDTIEQAIERSGTKAGNKGEEAALTALEMVSIMKQLGD